MSFLGRVFGLKDFVGPTNCSCPNVLVLNTSHDWPVYVSPGILLLLHYTVTALPKLHRHRPSHQVPALPTCGRPGVLLPPGPCVGVGLTLWLCFLQRKEVARQDEEQDLELDQLERGSQNREATQVSGRPRRVGWPPVQLAYHESSTAHDVPGA